MLVESAVDAVADVEEEADGYDCDEDHGDGGAYVGSCHGYFVCGLIRRVDEVCGIACDDYGEGEEGDACVGCDDCSEG